MEPHVHPKYSSSADPQPQLSDSVNNTGQPKGHEYRLRRAHSHPKYGPTLQNVDCSSTEEMIRAHLHSHMAVSGNSGVYLLGVLLTVAHMALAH